MAPIYIAAGFKSDCEELLKRFDNTKSIRLTKFVGVWQEMKFPLIFCGRRSFAELLEFTEEVLHIAKGYLLPSHEFQTRVFGLYLLYGLYNEQLTVENGKPYVKIRLTLEELKHTLDFVQKDLKEGSHWDAMFVFYKMLYMQEAFHFVLFPRQYGLERSFRKYFDDKYMAGAVEPAPFVCELRNLEDSGLLNKLSEACNKYYKYKCDLNDGKEPHSSLNLTSQDIAKDLRELMKPIYLDKDDEIGKRRILLREKAARSKQSRNTQSCDPQPGTSKQSEEEQDQAKGAVHKKQGGRKRGPRSKRGPWRSKQAFQFEEEGEDTTLAAEAAASTDSPCEKLNMEDLMIVDDEGSSQKSVEEAEDQVVEEKPEINVSSQPVV